jgi:hypothetical protein
MAYFCFVMRFFVKHDVPRRPSLRFALYPRALSPLGFMQGTSESERQSEQIRQTFAGKTQVQIKRLMQKEVKS